MSLNKTSTGKNWFQRHYKAMVGIIAPFCPALAGAIGAIGGAMDLYDQFSKISVDDLSPADQAILIPWDTNKFTPFYADLAHNLQNNVLDKTKELNSRLQFLNDIYLKIDAVKAYYINNENQGLTADGIANRLGYLDSTFQGIYDVVSQDNTLNSLPEVPITKNFKSIDLGYLAIPTTVADFYINSNVYQLSTGTPVLPSATTIASTPKLTTEEIKTTIASVTGTTPIINTDSTTTTTTTPTATNNSPSTGKILLFLGVSYFALDSLFSDEKKPKKASE